ncbi:hypothetical protein BJX61DRAFT_183946 [Aspergillus egyptiacus]|nr:hypothetical protein BJX61DRAFT_183946 [Aspergillus egyptiacus]
MTWYPINKNSMKITSAAAWETGLSSHQHALRVDSPCRRWSCTQASRRPATRIQRSPEKCQILGREAIQRASPKVSQEDSASSFPPVRYPSLYWVYLRYRQQ